MRVLTAGVLIVSLFLSSCGAGGDCALTCKHNPNALLSSCPGTREGCKAKKERLGCTSFDFGEANRTCRVSDCPEDACGFSGLTLFKEDEFETDLIRRNTEKGIPTGSGRFIRRLEKLSDRVLEYRPIGRPRKQN